MDWFDVIADKRVPPGLAILVSGESVVAMQGYTTIEQSGEEVWIPAPLVDAIKVMVGTFQAKSADYSDTDDQWDSNFAMTAEQFDLNRYEACEFNVVQKLARLRALRRRGTAPVNESVEDTYRDMMNYATYAYALYLEETAPKPAKVDTQIEQYTLPKDPAQDAVSRGVDRHAGHQTPTT